MATKLSDELKTAILRLPAKEKDKLLLRLVTKDKFLVKQLEFTLLEDSATTENRSNQVRETIQTILIQNDNHITSPGYLLMTIRHLNPLITDHVKITKDKFGEVMLTIFLLSISLRFKERTLAKYQMNRFDTLAPYVIKRIEQILTKIPKLHEDYYFEIRRDLNQLLEVIYRIPALAAYAHEANLPQKWDY
jgi:hypothetical protein